IIITGGRLTALIETEYFDNQEGGSEHLDDSLHRLQEPGFKGSEEERINKISTVIKEASEELLDYGHKLVLVYPIPAVGWNVPRRFKKLMKDKSNRVKAWLDHGGVTTSYKVFQTRNKRVYAIYDSIKDHPNLLRIYPEKLFCNRDYIGRCQTEDDKHIFYIDDNHLSLYGAKILVDDIFSKMEAKWQDIHWYEASNNIK
ncbi:MAG: SGNH hydrolase domain-containing protein, partial [Candidatus Melainabacteria bacterium]|nr:SGNH hydrolase domain-containing protein [Candidatus Melainabacteria bacterium]